jgi:hypothetical protein
MITLDRKLTPRQRTDREFAALLLLPIVDTAGTTWNRLAPRQYTNLLAALPGASISPPAGRFWWDPDRAQYALSRQGYIPSTAIRQALNDFNRAHAEEMASMAKAAAAGQIPAAQWLSAMHQAIKDAQVVNAAVGRGGVHQLTDEDLLAVAAAVDFQDQRLTMFGDQMEAGAVTAQSAGWRAAAYGKSAVSTFDGMYRNAGKAAGFTLERNVLGNAEHCYWNSDAPQPRPDCPGLTDLGWVNIGQIPKIGSRLCLWNCFCRIEFGG